MLLMIDNYDSFTYNLVQYFRQLGADVQTYRNDALELEDIEALNPKHIVLSPGPCTPNEAGLTLAVIHRFAGRIPLLGVCLGHQAIGQAFGARVLRARRVMHGKTDNIEHDGRGVFRGQPSPYRVVRYHSLVVSDQNLPDVIEVTARTSDGEIAGLRHRHMPVEGVQFHPESVESEHGLDLLKNFLDF